mmetsp:Transcript_75418/g.244019  ORF Transcript_75418/g.244019 Transcript_75418/m.244019 type:complete len:200 (-) Transcript_75418:749-1348(-)
MQKVQNSLALRPQVAPPTPCCLSGCPLASLLVRTSRSCSSPSLALTKTRAIQLLSRSSHGYRSAGDTPLTCEALRQATVPSPATLRATRSLLQSATAHLDPFAKAPSMSLASLCCLDLQPSARSLARTTRIPRWPAPRTHRTVQLIGVAARKTSLCLSSCSQRHGMGARIWIQYQLRRVLTQQHCMKMPPQKREGFSMR